MDMTQRVEDLIFLVEQLSVVLESENSALRDNDYKSVSATLEKKDNLSRAYESRMKGFGSAAGLQALEEDVAPELRAELHKTGENLNRKVQENSALLEATVEANRRVIDLIAEAVKSSKPGPGTYSGNGSIQQSELKGKPLDMPISVNQVL